MFKDFIDKITVHHSKSLPFVVYRKPEEENIRAVLQKDANLHHLNNFAETGFVFAPFDTRKKIVLLHCDERLEVVGQVKASRSEGLRPKSDDSQREVHINLVNSGIDRIRNNEFKKVVLSRRVAVDCADAPLDLFQELLTNYRNAFCYLWYHPKIGTWLGATPEILIKGENKQLTTMSLAGTQRYTGNDNPVWGDKELEEQELVTAYISDALKNKVNSLTVFNRESLKAGNLLHLRTKLVAKYEKEQLGNIIDALHPTPAVCGMPMLSSKNFILKNEDYDREYYTGYLGELNLKEETTRSSRKRNHENQAYKSIKTTTTFFVNLRCMQLKENKAFIYVGGGVTKDSDPQKEWEETVAKTNTMLKVLGVK